MNFATSVTVGSASVTTGVGTVSNATANGSQVTLDLTGVTNAQRITVTLFNISDGSHVNNSAVPMGVLFGDTSGNGTVNASDVGQTKANAGQSAQAANFRSDLNFSGIVTATDIAITKAQAGTTLP
jgi:hypothetical protein